eukprot:scaffold31559_cov32-Tisochrysis_lutea.AAC.9
MRERDGRDVEYKEYSTTVPGKLGTSSSFLVGLRGSFRPHPCIVLYPAIMTILFCKVFACVMFTRWPMFQR